MKCYQSKFLIKKIKNDKIVLWIPGANDTFYHQEQLDKGLFKGCDIFILHPKDYHPCDPDNETNPPGHTSENFLEYFDAIDKSICAHCLNYKDIIVYCHSTGALLLIEYALQGKYRNYITKVIFDDPFFAFNTNPVFQFIQKNIILFPLTWNLLFFRIVFNKFKILKKNSKSKTKVHQKSLGYRLPFVYENNDYAAFILCCIRTQKKINSAIYPLLSKPCLILIAEGDKMLREQDIKRCSKQISIEQEIHIIPKCYHSVLFPDDKSSLKSTIEIIDRFIINNDKKINNYKNPPLELSHNRILWFPTLCIPSMLMCILFYIYK